MNENIDSEIEGTEDKLRILRNKQHLQRYEIPPLEERAKELVGYGYSETMIQSKLWARRSQNVGMTEIVAAIEKALQARFILLESVGCYIDPKTKITYPAKTDNTADFKNPCGLKEIENKEWFNNLSEKDKKVVDDINIG
jgi:hypothetical protein